MIGAEKTADNFQKTIDMFGGAVPFDRGERIDMLDELSENEDFDGFEEIDDCYYENKVELTGGVGLLVYNFWKIDATVQLLPAPEFPNTAKWLLKKLLKEK